MGDKHMCQLRADEKAHVLKNIREALNRLENVSAPQDRKYCTSRLPNFLTGRVPKFRLNPELQPPITHTPTLEIRFTSDKKVASEKVDPQIIYATMPGPQNPFKPSYMVSDKICTDFCSEAQSKSAQGRGEWLPSNSECKRISPVCLSQLLGDAPRDGKGIAYDCEHNRKHGNLLVCHPQHGDQHYLCTRKR